MYNWALFNGDTLQNMENIFFGFIASVNIYRFFHKKPSCEQPVKCLLRPYSDVLMGFDCIETWAF